MIVTCCYAAIKLFNDAKQCHYVIKYIIALTGLNYLQGLLKRHIRAMLQCFLLVFEDKTLNFPQGYFPRQRAHNHVLRLDSPCVI